jgi:hypothetical protein
VTEFTPSDWISPIKAACLSRRHRPAVTPTIARKTFKQAPQTIVLIAADVPDAICGTERFAHSCARHLGEKNAPTMLPNGAERERFRALQKGRLTEPVPAERPMHVSPVSEPSVQASNARGSVRYQPWMCPENMSGEAYGQTPRCTPASTAQNCVEIV